MCTLYRYFSLSLFVSLSSLCLSFLSHTLPFHVPVGGSVGFQMAVYPWVPAHTPLCSPAWIGNEGCHSASLGRQVCQWCRSHTLPKEPWCGKTSLFGVFCGNCTLIWLKCHFTKVEKNNTHSNVLSLSENTFRHWKNILMTWHFLFYNR